MDLAAQINQLSPEQRQSIMHQQQQAANEGIMQEMMTQMVQNCFQKCTGTSVRTHFIMILIFLLYFHGLLVISISFSSLGDVMRICT